MGLPQLLAFLRRQAHLSRMGLIEELIALIRKTMPNIQVELEVDATLMCLWLTKTFSNRAVNLVEPWVKDLTRVFSKVRITFDAGNKGAARASGLRNNPCVGVLRGLCSKYNIETRELLPDLDADHTIAAAVNNAPPGVLRCVLSFDSDFFPLMRAGLLLRWDTCAHFTRDAEIFNVEEVHAQMHPDVPAEHRHSCMSVLAALVPNTSYKTVTVPNVGLLSGRTMVNKWFSEQNLDDMLSGDPGRVKTQIVNLLECGSEAASRCKRRCEMALKNENFLNKLTESVICVLARSSRAAPQQQQHAPRSLLGVIDSTTLTWKEVDGTHNVAGDTVRPAVYYSPTGAQLAADDWRNSPSLSLIDHLLPALEDVVSCLRNGAQSPSAIADKLRDDFGEVFQATADDIEAMEDDTAAIVSMLQDRILLAKCVAGLQQHTGFEKYYSPATVDPDSTLGCAGHRPTVFSRTNSNNQHMKKRSGWRVDSWLDAVCGRGEPLMEIGYGANGSKCVAKVPRPTGWLDVSRDSFPDFQLERVQLSVFELPFLLLLGTAELPPGFVVSHLCHNGKKCELAAHLVLEDTRKNASRNTCKGPDECKCDKECHCLVPGNRLDDEDKADDDDDVDDDNEGMNNDNEDNEAGHNQDEDHHNDDDHEPTSETNRSKCEIHTAVDTKFKSLYVQQPLRDLMVDCVVSVGLDLFSRGNRRAQELNFDSGRIAWVKMLQSGNVPSIAQGMLQRIAPNTTLPEHAEEAAQAFDKWQMSMVQYCDRNYSECVPCSTRFINQVRVFIASSQPGAAPQLDDNSKSKKKHNEVILPALPSAISYCVAHESNDLAQARSGRVYGAVTNAQFSAEMAATATRHGIVLAKPKTTISLEDRLRFAPMTAFFSVLFDRAAVRRRAANQPKTVRVYKKKEVESNKKKDKNKAKAEPKAAGTAAPPTAAASAAPNAKQATAKMIDEAALERATTTATAKKQVAAGATATATKASSSATTASALVNAWSARKVSGLRRNRENVHDAARTE